MNDKEAERPVLSVSVLQVLKIIKRYLVPILVISIVAGAAAYIISAKFIKPKYRATAMVYVQAKDYASVVGISTTDINVAQRLANTYSIILKTDGVLDRVVEGLNNSVTSAQIKRSLTAEPIDNSEIFTISYTDTDPELAMKVVNAVAEIAPEKIIEIVKTGEASVIQTQKNPPVSPVSPNVGRNTVIVFIAAFILSATVFVFATLLDTRIRSVDDITEMFDYPVFGSVPTITSEVSDGQTAEDEDDD